jgi:hypothetical protein
VTYVLFCHFPAFPVSGMGKVSDFSKFKEGMRDEVRLEEKEREKA